MEYLFVQFSKNCTIIFRIIAALSLEERGLFRERIRFLDKKIHAGLTKLTWASKGISDYFVTECRMHSSKIQGIVDEYKVCTAKLQILKDLIIDMTSDSPTSHFKYQNSCFAFRSTTICKFDS